MSRLSFWVSAAGVLACSWGFVPGQPKPASAREVESAREPLTERLGEKAVAALLASEREAERERGLERLSLPWPASARERLLTILQGASALSEQQSLRLVESVGRFAAEPAVAALLERIILDAGVSDPKLLRRVQGAAALALARAHRPKPTAFLVAAMRRAGASAEAARAALLAYPPADLRVLCGSEASPMALDLLAELAGLEALPCLRELVRKAPMELSLSASVAMAKLGSREPLNLAARWAKASHPALREAAAAIFVLLDESGAEKLVAELLEQAETRSQGLVLAAARPRPLLIKPLGEALAKGSPEERTRALEVLARIEDEAAPRLLLSWAQGSELLSEVARALAVSPTEAAESALLRAASRAEGWHRRLWLRALLVRRESGERVPGLESLLEPLATAKGQADRAVYAWARAALDPESRAAALAAKEPVFLWAAASLAQDASNCRLAAERLGSERSAVLVVSLARCLHRPEVWQLVPEATLAALLEHSVTAPLGALVLSSRLRTHAVWFEELLSSGDEAVRAGAYLGLSVSRASWRGHRAQAGYAIESSERVRYAMLLGAQGLAEGSAVRRLWLQSVEWLEPEPFARRAALALARGGQPWPQVLGDQPVWIFSGHGATRAVGVELASGLTLPQVPDPDGFVVVTRAAKGAYGVRLALANEFEHLERALSATRGGLAP